MSKKGTLGVSRSLFNKFMEHKKLNKTNTSGIFELNDSGGKLMKINGNCADSSLIAGESEHVEIFNQSNKLYKEIDEDFTKLQVLQQERIKPKFNDDDNKRLNESINSLANSITKKIFECDNLLKKLSQFEARNKYEFNIKENMKKNLQTKLSIITKNITKNEEQYLIKYKELGQEDSARFSQKSKDNDFLEMSLNNSVLRKRDDDINNLVSSVQELSTIFKQMAGLVHEQGTILDRIDYNVELAFENTKKANESLSKTERITETNNCARNAIMFLLILNFCLAIILLYKLLG